MSRKYINEQWREFEYKVLRNLSRTQRTEMQKAFYAGCGAMFDILVVNAPDDENDFTLIEDIKAEVFTWLKQQELKKVQ